MWRSQLVPVLLATCCLASAPTPLAAQDEEAGDGRVAAPGEGEAAPGEGEGPDDGQAPAEAQAPGEEGAPGEGATPAEGGGEAPATPEDRLREALRELQGVGERLGVLTAQLYERLRSALEIHATDPKASEGEAWERLARDEQLAWRIAHLQGYLEALERARRTVGGTAEEGLAPQELPSLYAALERFAASYQEALSLVEHAQGSPELEQLMARVQERYEVLSRRLDPDVFAFPRREDQPAPPLARRVLPEEGFFAPVPEGELSGRRSFTELLEDAPAAAEEARQPEPPAGIVVFDVWLLRDLEDVIVPVRRDLRALELERDRLEIERLRELGGATGAKAAAAEPEVAERDLSPPARIAQRIDAFEVQREVQHSLVRESYLRYLQQARALGGPPPPEELLAPDGLGFELSEESRREVLSLFELATGELAGRNGDGLIRARDRLSEELEAVRQELADLQTAAYTPVVRVARLLLGARSLALARRLEGVGAAIRSQRSRLHVAEELVHDAVERLHTFDERVALLEERWRSAALEHYGWSVVRVVAILVVAWLLIRIVAAVSSRVVARLSARSLRTGAEADARARTIQSVFVTTVRVVVWVLAFLMILGQFDINYGPLLLATGGITLAIGFGAQSLVKDFVSGFFILLENQYAVGDIIEIAGKGGVVEGIDLRTTRVRSVEGTLHTIPNGEISLVSNLTHTWSRADMTIGVAYHEDPEEVAALLNRLGQEMAADPEWAEKVLEAPTVWGIDNFGSSSIDFRVVGKTRPAEQWAVAREFRKRVKVAFDREGVEIPFQYVNYVETQPRRSKVLDRAPAPAGSGDGAASPPPSEAAEAEAVREAEAARQSEEEAGEGGLEGTRAGRQGRVP